MNIQLHPEEIQAIATIVAAIVITTLQPQVKEAIENGISSQISELKTPPAVTADDNLLNQSQVAEIIGLSEKWLEKKRCYGGGIPFIKIDSAVRYERKEVEKFINNRRL